MRGRFENTFRRQNTYMSRICDSAKNSLRNKYPQNAFTHIRNDKGDIHQDLQFASYQSYACAYIRVWRRRVFVCVFSMTRIIIYIQCFSLRILIVCMWYVTSLQGILMTVIRCSVDVDMVGHQYLYVRQRNGSGGLYML